MTGSIVGPKARGTLTILLLLAAASELPAQTVRGQVTDSTGAALAGAVVILERAGQESMDPARATTDERGRFRFANVPYGYYVLRARLIGYRPLELALRVPREGITEQQVTLQRMPQLLARVRIVDQDVCAPGSIAGFECRRAAGVGLYRDAGELLAMRPRYWADMLDGMPGIRRVMATNDWLVGAPAGRCIIEIWNGLPFEGVRPDPKDIIALEYYDSYDKVPDAYKAYAWTEPPGGERCALVNYWARGARLGVRDTLKE